MSDRVGDRLLIGILILIACFAVFVTVSGQSSPTPKHGHCNPFDPECDADATFTPTPTPTPDEVWPTVWTDTGDIKGTCATREKKQSRTSNRGNTQTRWVSDRYGDETWPSTWTDTGNTRGSGAAREKEQSKTSSCGRTRTRWVDDPEDTPTPTAAATATPVSATGSLRAASSTIYVAASTTVYAEWDLSELTVNLDIATSSQAILWRSSRCSGGVQGRIGPEPPDTATLTVWGCKPGSGTVELRNFSGNTLLASVTITVKNPPPTSTPPAVSDLTATASTTSVRLSWDDLDGATKYRVEHRLSTSTGAWTPVDTTASGHTVTSLAPGTSYAFKVRPTATARSTRRNGGPRPPPP